MTQIGRADPSTEMDGSTVTTLQAALAYAQSIVDTVREPMLVVDGTLHIRTAAGRSMLCSECLARTPKGNSSTSDPGNGISQRFASC